MNTQYLTGFIFYVMSKLNSRFSQVEYIGEMDNQVSIREILQDLCKKTLQLKWGENFWLNNQLKF